MRQITNFYEPDKELETEYGLISYERWMQLECNRMHRRNMIHKIEKDKIGLIAIFREII